MIEDQVARREALKTLLAMGAAIALPTDIMPGELEPTPKLVEFFAWERPGFTYGDLCILRGTAGEACRKIVGYDPATSTITLDRAIESQGVPEYVYCGQGGPEGGRENHRLVGQRGGHGVHRLDWPVILE